MNSTQKIKDIKYLINEHYSNKEPLNESQQKSKECFNRYCDDIEKELKAFKIIERTAMKLVSIEDSENGICVNGRYAIYDNELYQNIDITKEEYDLLKEVLENE